MANVTRSVTTLYTISAEGAAAGAVAGAAANEKLIKATERLEASQGKLQNQLAKLEREFTPLQTKLDKYGAQLERVSKMTVAEGAETERLGRIKEGLQRKIDAVTTAIMKENVAHQQGAEAVQKAGAKSQYYMTQLSFQANDIATSLASGSSPFQVMAQQSGQIVQVFQQAGDQASVLKARILGLVATYGPVVALAGGVYLITQRAIENQRAVKSLDATLQLAGRTADTTGAQLLVNTKQLKAYGVAATDAAAAVKGLAANQNVPTGSALRLGKIAEDTSAVRETDFSAEMSRLTSLYTGGFSALEKYNKETRVLNEVQMAAARAMFQNGNGLGAINTLLTEVEARTKGAAEELRGPFAAAWKEVANGVSTFIDRIANSKVVTETLNGWGIVLRAINGETKIGTPEMNAYADATKAMAKEQQKLIDLQARKDKNAMWTTPVTDEELQAQKNRVIEVQNAWLGARDAATGAAKATKDMVDLTTQGATNQNEFRGKIIEGAEALERYGEVMSGNAAQRQLNLVYEQEYQKQISAGATPINAAIIATQAYAKAEIDLNAALRDNNQQLSESARLTLAVANGYARSTAAGIQADAMRQASLEALTTHGLNPAIRAQQILDEKGAESLASAQQTIAANKLEIDALEKLTQAYGTTGEAKRQAQAQYEAEKETRQALAIAQARGDELAVQEVLRLREFIAQQKLKVGSLQDEQRVRDTLSSQNDTLAELRLQISLTGQSSAAIAKQVAEMRTRNQLMAQGGPWTDEKEQIVANSGAIADLTDRMQEWGNVNNQILDNIMSGWKGLGSLWSSLKKQIEAAVIRPLLAPIVGQITAPFYGLGGGAGGAPGTGMAVAPGQTAPGGIGGMLSGAGGAFSSFANTANLGGQTVGGWFGGSDLGAAMPWQGGVGSMGIGSVLGTAGMGYGVGSMLGGLVRPSGRYSSTYGGIGGALGGLAGGALLGASLGMFAGPVGMIVGGILGSMLGPGKDWEGAESWIGNDNGVLKVGGTGSENMDGDAFDSQNKKLVKGVNKALKSYGIRANYSAWLGEGQGRGFKTPEDFIEDLIQSRQTSGGEKGLVADDPTLNHILTKTKATTLEELGADVEIGKVYDALVKSGEASKALTASMGALSDAQRTQNQLNQDAVDTVTAFIDAIDDQQEKFADLGLDTDASMGAIRANVEQYLASIDGTGKVMGEGELAVAQLRAQFDALPPLLEKVGLSTELAAEGFKRALKDLQDTTMLNLQMENNTAHGLEYLNDAARLMQARTTTVANITATFAGNVAGMASALDLVQDTFVTSAQNIVDSAKLTGDAFDRFIAQFPDLAGVVHQFVDTVIPAATTAVVAATSTVNNVTTSRNTTTLAEINARIYEERMAEALRTQTDAANTLRDAAQKLLDAASQMEEWSTAMNTSDLSPLSLEQKVQSAQAAFESDPNAQTGDTYLRLLARYEYGGPEYKAKYDDAMQKIKDKIAANRAQAASMMSQADVIQNTPIDTTGWLIPEPVDPNAAAMADYWGKVEQIKSALAASGQVGDQMNSWGTAGAEGRITGAATQFINSAATWNGSGYTWNFDNANTGGAAGIADLNDLTKQIAQQLGLIPSYAVGTMNHKGGLARVHDGELINLPSGTQVLTKSKTDDAIGRIGTRTKDEDAMAGLLRDLLAEVRAGNTEKAIGDDRLEAVLLSLTDEQRLARRAADDRRFTPQSVVK